MNIAKEASITRVQEQEIRNLIDMSNKQDNTNYAFDYSDDFKKDGETNLFLLYDDKNLLGFISIFSPGKTEAELTAIVSPGYRQKGCFNYLLSEAADELKGRNIDSILFVCDYNSIDGNSTAKSIDSKYEFSEYLMKYSSDKSNIDIDSSTVLVTEAKLADKDRLININAFHSNREEACGMIEANFQSSVRNLYSIIYENNIVGMIGVLAETDRQYIYGFCIDKEYRGRGLGRKSLNLIVEKCLQEDNMKEICLEVQTDNENALGLYRGVGFELVTEFKYYRKSTKTIGPDTL